MKRCPWHDGPVMDDRAVLVAAVPRSAAPDEPVYACRDCVARLGIVPLADRTDPENGRPLIVGRRDGPPIMPGDASGVAGVGN